MAEERTDIFLLDVEVNAEGNKLAYLSKEGAGVGFRIAGPKAWGGSRNLARLKIQEDDLVRFIKEYAPEIIPKLIVPPISQPVISESITESRP